MEKRFVMRGAGAGALAGMLAFIFTRIFAEPVIQASINYDDARTAVQAALNKAAGLAPPPPGPDIFSRSVQRNIGVGVGLILFGVAMGALFAVAYVVIGRRVRLSPRALAIAIAGGGFFGIYMVPFLKYPANPPAIGHPDTIHARGELYIAMVAISVLALIGATVVAGRLKGRFGPWNAGLLAGVGFAVVVGLAMAILPPLGHLHANVVAYGRHLTETPLPLKNPQGQIVFPGFPADVLATFRLYSIINQLILWGSLSLVFGFLAERLLADTHDAGEPVVAAASPVGV